jgi:hypothetical protein
MKGTGHQIARHYDRFNDGCTHMFYWWHYLHHVVCQITMSDLMMNVHTCFTDDTTYTMVYVTLLSIMWSDIQHGVGSVISKTCVYIHH